MDENLATVPIPTTLNQGYQLKWVLDYIGNNVSACVFTILTNTGATLGTVSILIAGQTNLISGGEVSPTDTAPIVAIQFSIGGEAGGGQGSIVAGAAGTVTYSATNPLTVLTGIPGPVTYRGGTGENANINWGLLPTLTNTSITQGFHAVFTPGIGERA